MVHDREQGDRTQDEAFASEHLVTSQNELTFDEFMPPEGHDDDLMVQSREDRPSSEDAMASGPVESLLTSWQELEACIASIRQIMLTDSNEQSALLCATAQATIAETTAQLGERLNE
jgi:hypothetical protein